MFCCDVVDLLIFFRANLPIDFYGTVLIWLWSYEISSLFHNLKNWAISSKLYSMEMLNDENETHICKLTLNVLKVLWFVKNFGLISELVTKLPTIQSQWFLIRATLVQTLAAPWTSWRCCALRHLQTMRKVRLKELRLHLKHRRVPGARNQINALLFPYVFPSWCAGCLVCARQNRR